MSKVNLPQNKIFNYPYQPSFSNYFFERLSPNFLSPFFHSYCLLTFVVHFRVTVVGCFMVIIIIQLLSVVFYDGYRLTTNNNFFLWLSLFDFQWSLSSTLSFYSNSPTTSNHHPRWWLSNFYQIFTDKFYIYIIFYSNTNLTSFYLKST